MIIEEDYDKQERLDRADRILDRETNKDH